MAPRDPLQERDNKSLISANRRECMIASAPDGNKLLMTIREENLNVYRASPQRLREDVGQEHQIAQDYRGRLIYELLQNADDAMASEDSGAASIRIVLTDDALW